MAILDLLSAWKIRARPPAARAAASTNQPRVINLAHLGDEELCEIAMAAVVTHFCESQIDTNTRNLQLLNLCDLPRTSTLDVREVTPELLERTRLPVLRLGPLVGIERLTPPHASEESSLMTTKRFRQDRRASSSPPRRQSGSHRQQRLGPIQRLYLRHRCTRPQPCCTSPLCNFHVHLPLCH